MVIAPPGRRCEYDLSEVRCTLVFSTRRTMHHQVLAPLRAEDESLPLPVMRQL